MAGVWYEVERSFHLMEMSASCTSVSVALNDKNHLLINVTTYNKWTGHPSSISGVGVPGGNGSALLRYRVSHNRALPPLVAKLAPGAGLYHVLATDYRQYALLYACSSIGVAHADHLWVLGRRRELSAEVRAHVYALLADWGLDSDRLLLSKNTDCPNP